MEALTEHAEIKKFKRQYIITTVIGICLIILTFYWLQSYSGGFSFVHPSTEFNWHPLLMVIGMVYLYSQAILVYKVGINMKKFTVKCIHAALHIVIIILASIALKAVFDSHNYAKPPIANMYSLHSWLGMGTYVLFWIQLVIGFTVFLYPGASLPLRATVLPYHVLMGTAIFIMAIVTSVLGYAEKVMFSLGNDYQKNTFPGILMNLIGIITVVFGIQTLYLLTHFHLKREEIVEGEVHTLN